VDPDEPEHWFVLSPFASYDEWWYTKTLGWAAQFHEEIGEIIRRFHQEANEFFSLQRQALEESKIELLQEIPLLRMVDELAEVKREVISAYRAKIRVEENPEDLDTFFMRCQRVLEAVLDACLKKLDDRESLVHKVSASDFRYHLQRMADELKIDLPKTYVRKSYAGKLAHAARLRGQGVRERALLLFLDAYYHQEHSRFLFVLKAEPGLLGAIDEIVVTRNQLAHYSEEIVIEDKYTVINKAYHNLKTILNLLVTHFFRG
jgi:hypothetical protein